jgi:rhomboid protease GluP
MRFLSPPGSASFFETPHAIVYLLIAANIVAYGVCFSQSDTAVLPAGLLLRSGAMYPLAIERHEYWRLIAYGFLHADLLHLAVNLLCLTLWGGHLEKRVGPFYFLAIFVGALIFAAIVSNFTHSGGYLAVGASGGISGILGALLCLWILGKSEFSVDFFVANIGLNAALASINSNIDWAAHLG